MPTRRRLTAVAVALAAAILTLSTPASVQAVGELSPLPDSRLLFDSNRTGNYELFSLGTDGSSPLQITDDPAFDSWWPKLSPDRSRIVFHRTPAGTHDRDYTKTSIWSVNVDGTDLRQIVPNRAFGWELLGHPEWSPDGRRLVVFGGTRKSPQVFTLSADGGDPRQVTQRPGQNLDPSWSPDGRSILFVGCPPGLCTPAQYEVYRIGADGSGETRLTDDLQRDHDPYYSPDGTQIAWLRLAANWSLFAMSADGSDQRGVVSGGHINSKPAWDADGSWLYFHRTSLGRTGFSLFKVRPDGSELTELVPRPVIAFGPYDDEYPVHSLT